MRESGKITLAVRLGDARTRMLYQALLASRRGADPGADARHAVVRRRAGGHAVGAARRAARAVRPWRARAHPGAARHRAGHAGLGDRGGRRRWRWRADQAFGCARRNEGSTDVDGSDNNGGLASTAVSPLAGTTPSEERNAADRRDQWADATSDCSASGPTAPSGWSPTTSCVRTSTRPTSGSTPGPESRPADSPPATNPPRSMAIEASREALAKASLTAADIDGVIVATSTHFLQTPPCAPAVAAALGATGISAFDIASGVRRIRVCARRRGRHDPRRERRQDAGHRYGETVADGGHARPHQLLHLRRRRRRSRGG